MAGRGRGRSRVFPRNTADPNQGIPQWRVPGNFGEGSSTNHRGGHQNGNHWQRRNRSASSSSDQSNQQRYNNQNRRGGRNSSEAREPRQQFRMGFKALENLLEKSSEDIILELLNSKKGFANFLKTDLSDDAIVLITKILKKVCDSPFFENKYKVLQTYFDDPFDKTLTNYIMRLPLHDKTQKYKNNYFWKATDDFWNDVLGICGDILDSIPTFAVKVLPPLLKCLHVYIPTFESEHSRHISDEIKENVRKLHETVQAMVKENEEREKARIEKKVLQQTEEEPPPDDFREISVYPNSHELISSNSVYLRPNVTKGPYRDVDHYLDVQFRLLREDFVRPLRSGIETFRSESNKRPENVKIYKKVRFLNPETINEYYCARLQFDFSKKKLNFRYENSRRFMFGSLLCFTRDNFKTFIFGKVAERKEEDLGKAQLIVGFDEDVKVLYQTDYVMVECSVFFEPYFHVLSVLKTMRADNFPMEKYIIRVDSAVEPPEYLAAAPGLWYKVENRSFLPLSQWPNKRFYDLNDSQLAAFRAAVTQEYAIIQGPPGTGKTYLGLKIAKTLLENKQAWYKKTPMLVICFTNHALDQFLEGILTFTDSIMRVGGQSKNEKLQAYNLRNRGRFKRNPAVCQQRDEVQRSLRKIKNITENLKQVNLYEGVVDFDAFQDSVPNYRNTWFYKANRDEIIEWLFGGRGNQQQLPIPEREYENIEKQLTKMTINDESDDAESIPELVDDVEMVDDDIFDIIDIDYVRCSVPLLTVSSIATEAAELQNIVSQLNYKWAREPATFEELMEEEKSRLRLMILNGKYDYLKLRLAQGKHNSSLEAPNVNLANPNAMAPDDRWNLYFYWLNLYKTAMNQRLDSLNQRFREDFKVYEEMRNMENTKQMRDVEVIGMTTTGAARLRATLQTLKSPIVIVEEAAEVLEAHIVTSITKDCQHLILIGDHQQLKPSTADYSIEQKFDLGISLFERMVINDIQCYTLGVQHRMRPEIANLIRPTIYPVLEDHGSVLDRPSILGVDSNLFFIDHSHAEDDCEGTTKKNYHEVKFLIAFARHLILNGYKQEQITILAAYLGQMFELQKEKKKHQALLQNVRISVLDNYQGEECDIILLSLVRSNPDNKIGFLSIENRVCVALSRARNGLYVMGNMTQLCEASGLWRKIRATLQEQNSLGIKLPLKCQIHETVTHVEKGSDFLDIPEGGCAAKCHADLACGHKCTSFCHILDRDHKDYKCRAPCTKRLCDSNESHVCRKMCYQECGPCTYPVPRKLACQHVVDLACHIDPDTYQCEEPVSTVLPCGHVADKPCHYDPAVYRCPHPCETKVEPCGHACRLPCHVRNDPDHLEYKCTKPCAKYRKNCSVKTDQHLCRKRCCDECDECTIVVRKARTVCPHYYDVACSANVDELECLKPCTKLLGCGHKCKRKCNEPCGICWVKVTKTVATCGHPVEVECWEEADRKLCRKECPLKLPCGHPCTRKCNQPCTPTCAVLVACNKKLRCGHTVTQLACHVANQETGKLSRKYCNTPCKDQLMCGHRCTGSCGECSQGRVHKRCSEACGVPLVCDHLCEIPCRQSCKPCTKSCMYRCKHSRCRKKCGEECTPCKEECTRRCAHQKCTKKCGDFCDVPPCTQPCRKNLKCGHGCIGFCGDPCPDKCLVCDREEVTEIFLGSEDEEGARFVVLEDCGHLFESGDLERWFQKDEDQISFKTCPRCKTPVKTTQRFSDHIKRAMADVAKVKAKSNGNVQENEDNRKKLLLKIEPLKATSSTLTLLCPELRQVVETIENRLKAVRNKMRQPINKHDLNAITSKLQIVEYINKICCDSNNPIRDAKAIYFPQIKFISKILLREEDQVTDQEIDDINFELNRLSRMVEFSKIRASPNFAARFASNSKVQTTVAEVEEWIFGSGKFYAYNEDKTKQLLKDLVKLLACGIGISESEKREILKAMDLQKGHWFKCPNGHPYVITECGGAMQVSTCNECGAAIGGSHHRLLATNAVATEMDGARHGAWTEAANFLNFNLRNLV